MVSHIIKRTVTMFVVLFGVVTLTFFLMRFADGDPATIIALDQYGSQLISPEVISQLAERQGLNQPVLTQYINWLTLAAKGSFGRSLQSGVPVLDEIKQRLPSTLRLAVAAMVLTAIIAIPCGVLAACRQGGWFDRITRAIAAIKVSVPNFYMALILILVFSVYLQWLPSFGTGDISHLILPVAVLVLSQIGFTLRIVRSSVADILDLEYVQYAVLRGLSRRRILFVHVLKNALVPVMTYLSLQFLMVLEGSVIVETVFACPGLGQLFQQAIIGRDFTMIQALVLLSGIMIVLTNFSVDMAYLFVNRRMQPAGA